MKRKFLSFLAAGMLFTLPAAAPSGGGGMSGGGGSHNANTKELVAQFQLEDLLQTEVSKLSGGMKRRLSIACALVENPPFLLMDEPTTALDLYYKESIHQWMKTYQQKNGIILMTTHDESEIRNADRCLFMDEGKVQELDAEDILQKFAGMSE